MFSLTVSLNVLEHLGINLYSNVPSVLSEIVANAWDADAEEIRIDWDRDQESIVIADDGIGMTPEEVNNRFLTVGYRRRDEQPGKTPMGRSPMGRKGIGKLSLFSVADWVDIETAKAGHKSAFRMKLPEIRRKIEEAEGDGTYYPEILPTDTIDFEHGTRITLTNLRKRHTIRTTQALKRRLARRFSIIGEAEGFRIFVDGEEVTPADRDYYDKIQYLWTYGDHGRIADLCVNAKKFDRSAAMTDNDPQINGWLGTVKEVRHLKDEDDDNLNRIAIFVRGKMAQEDILGDFSERGVYASYLIGDLRDDSLDIYDGPGTQKDDDAATSSRQRMVEDDERYIVLKRLIGRELKYIQSEWSKLRSTEGAERALEIPAVSDWMDGLKPATKEKARRWLGKLNRIRVDDLNEQKQLIKHAVLAFEFYQAKESLDTLDTVDDDNLQAILDIFRDIDNLEASLYGQIVQQRVEVIRALEEKIDTNDLEKAIQRYLFDHLWLLDPAWERAENSQIMERPVTALFEKIDAGLTADQRRGRLDIKYRKTAGQHVIIELKRPERVVSTGELIAQVGKYLSGMRALLKAQGTPYEPIQFVILLGRKPSDWDDDDTQASSLKSLESYNSRIVFYEGLLRNARQAYQDYMENRNKLDRLQEIIKAIEDYAIPDQDAAVG